MFRFISQELVSDIISSNPRSLEFWMQLVLVFVALYLRLYVHFIGTTRLVELLSCRPVLCVV